MQQRSVFGWLLVGAFCAGVSCGGGNNSSTPQGFGVPCSSAKDCSSYNLLCGAEQKCVQCRGAGDCDGAEVCSKALCITQDECQDSRDCRGEQVCDEDAGVCVDCLTSGDCATGQSCTNNACADRPACKFTSDCTGGLVCDMGLDACVTCRNDDDCDVRRECEDYECVTPGSNGGSGSGGKGSGTGGKGTAGNAGTGTAGMVTGGTGSGGMSGSAGTSGSVGEGGVGGAADCACALDDVCTADFRCVAPTVIDDLVDCDDQILAIEGRSGAWAADADLGVALSYGFGDPGVTFGDRTCAAWASGTELTLNDPDTTFAFTGFLLNDGLPYDLSQYSGLQIQLESTATYVQVVLKTSGGGYFQVTLSPNNGAVSYPRTAPFDSMLVMNNSEEALLDLATVTEVQFSVTTPKSFKFAVHRVALY